MYWDKNGQGDCLENYLNYMHSSWIIGRWSNWIIFVFKVRASGIAMMVCFDVGNDVSFIGGVVISRMLSGSDKEKVRHDKALERLT